VYLDPSNPPAEIMLQWNPGDWEHRAYWGANAIPSGANNTQSRWYMGSLPALGRWVRLEVPASRVGLEGATLTGMAFTLFSGRASWDHAGLSPTPCTDTDAAFCARLGKNCGAASGTDNCSNPRYVASCGTCTAPQACSLAGVCGGAGCTPES